RAAPAPAPPAVHRRGRRGRRLPHRPGAARPGRWYPRGGDHHRPRARPEQEHRPLPGARATADGDHQHRAAYVGGTVEQGLRRGDPGPGAPRPAARHARRDRPVRGARCPDRACARGGRHSGRGPDDRSGARAARAGVHEAQPMNQRPAFEEAVLLATYQVPDRSRPYLRANVIASLDGAATYQGLSGGLNGPAYKQVFELLRRLADVVIVGAGTVRAEGYGGMRLEEVDVAWRRAQGLSDHPVFAIVSGRLDLDPTSPV